MGVHGLKSVNNRPGVRFLTRARTRKRTRFYVPLHLTAHEVADAGAAVDAVEGRRPRRCHQAADVALAYTFMRVALALAVTRATRERGRERERERD